MSQDIEALKRQVNAAVDHQVMVRAVGKKKKHFVKKFFPCPPQRWRTFCGWRFAGSAYDFPDDQTGVICKTCKKLLAKASSDSSDGDSVAPWCSESDD